MKRRNYKYIKGVRFERLLVNNARDKGQLAFRSAGSKSPIDVCIFDEENKTLYLIQAKASKTPQKALKREFERVVENVKVIFKWEEKES